jgi:hypothetical protein
MTIKLDPEDMGGIFWSRVCDGVEICWPLDGKPLGRRKLALGVRTIPRGASEIGSPIAPGSSFHAKARSQAQFHHPQVSVNDPRRWPSVGRRYSPIHHSTLIHIHPHSNPNSKQSRLVQDNIGARLICISTRMRLSSTRYLCCA